MKFGYELWLDLAEAKGFDVSVLREFDGNVFDWKEDDLWIGPKVDQELIDFLMEQLITDYPIAVVS